MTVHDFDWVEANCRLTCTRSWLVGGRNTSRSGACSSQFRLALAKRMKNFHHFGALGRISGHSLHWERFAFIVWTG
jgi:hypothetical protein